eukprot:jgi/Undpi1/4294/HiC_scaffold_17.g07660.m1
MALFTVANKQEPPLCEEPVYSGFEEMMTTLTAAAKRPKRRSAVEMAPDDEQRWFDGWRYVSPQTLRIESGIANAVEGMEANFNFKVMQLMGDSPLPPSSPEVSKKKKAGKAVKGIGRTKSKPDSPVISKTSMAGTA